MPQQPRLPPRRRCVAYWMMVVIVVQIIGVCTFVPLLLEESTRYDELLRSNMSQQEAWKGLQEVADAQANVPIVSFIMPTTQARQKFHSFAYNCFQSQLRDNIELLVYDETVDPSPTFAAFLTAADDDPSSVHKVRYYTHTEKMTLGSKRNFLIDHARGTYIAHLDDDDYYAPWYVDHMLSMMQKLNAQVIKLSGWFLFDCTTDVFAYADLNGHINFEYGKTVYGGLKTAFLEDNEDSYGIRTRESLGYGFSLVWLNKPDLRFKSNKHFSEDYEFVIAAQRLRYRFAQFDDETGVAMVIKHAHHMAGVAFQYILPTGLVRLYFPEPVLLTELDSRSRNAVPVPRLGANVRSTLESLTNVNFVFDDDLATVFASREHAQVGDNIIIDLPKPHHITVLSANSGFETKDVLLDAQAIISCVYLDKMFPLCLFDSTGKCEYADDKGITCDAVRLDVQDNLGHALVLNEIQLSVDKG